MCIIDTTQRAVIDLRISGQAVRSGHLKLGGSNPAGETLEINSHYMLRNGQPFLPVMGEFHFSRFGAEFWEDELLKIKAGGIDIVATYVFWNHIEEDEGVFDWSGQKNLRRFIECCLRCDLYAVVRMGPFDHGECRNGGLPDWLYGQPFPLRSNDERYLAYVRRLYGEIAQQITGLLYKDGGPIMGIQLENEYMHCGAPWEVTFKPGTEWVPSGSDGVAHLLALKQIALDCGLHVPLYTCTGWLRSPVPEGEMLPMQGGYAYTPWSPDPNYVQPPTREFLFRNRALNPLMNGKPTYDPALVPFACCEIGGGIQDTYYHRNVVPPESVEALAVLNLAGGANLIGYYMYHGGSNPVGKHSYMNEFTVPRISYDFQAPIREFGQCADSYRYLRLLHTFLHDFGGLLATMDVVLPANASVITPEDTENLRWAVRVRENSGFVFLNNFQDHVDMQDISGIQLELNLPNQPLKLPLTESLILQKDVCAILPFGLTLHDVKLHYATTQLLTSVEHANKVTYVFFAPRGMLSEYAFDPTTFSTCTVRGGTVSSVEGYTLVRVNPGLDSLITLTTTAKTLEILTLTRAQAEHSTKQRLWDQERLVISRSTLVTQGDEYWFYSRDADSLDMWLYPAPSGTLSTPAGDFTALSEGIFTHYAVTIPLKVVSVHIEKIDERKAIIRFPPDLLDTVHNVVLQVDYVGDIGQLFVQGKLVADNFYNGTTWEIGLKQAVPDLREALILITPIVPSVGSTYIPTGMAFKADTETNSIGILQAVRALAEYKIKIKKVDG